MSLLKSSVNYVPTGRAKGPRGVKPASNRKRRRTPLQTQLAAANAARTARSQGGAAARSQGGAAAARSQGGAAARSQGGAAARASRAVNKRARDQERHIGYLGDTNRRLQRELADTQEDLLIAKAAKLRESGKEKRLNITRLEYRGQQLQREGPQLSKNMKLAFSQLQEAQEAMDRVKKTYDQSVAKIEKAKKESDDITMNIEFLQDDLKLLEAEYNQFPAAATFNISFDGNLAAHMQYLSLSDPVCV